MEFRFDPEMTADLYYQVAVDYVDSPDLRVTWMENLSTYHIARENWAEAAQCKIAIAALIAEYLGAHRPITCCFPISLRSPREPMGSCLRPSSDTRLSLPFFVSDAFHPIQSHATLGEQNYQ